MHWMFGVIRVDGFQCLGPPLACCQSRNAALCDQASGIQGTVLSIVAQDRVISDVTGEHNTRQKPMNWVKRPTGHRLDESYKHRGKEVLGSSLLCGWGATGCGDTEMV